MSENEQDKNRKIKYKNLAVVSIIEELKKLNLSVKHEVVEKYSVEELLEFLNIIVEIEQALNI